MGSANRSSTGKGSRAEVSPRFLSVGRVDQSTASNQQNTKRKPRGGFQKSGVGSPLPSLTPLAGVRSRRCALPQVCAGKCSQKGGAAAWGRGEQFALCLVACWRLGLSIFTFWSLARVYKRSVQSPHSPHCPPPHWPRLHSCPKPATSSRWSLRRAVFPCLPTKSASWTCENDTSRFP